LAVNTTHLVVKFVISTGVTGFICESNTCRLQDQLQLLNSTEQLHYHLITGLVIRQGSNTGTNRRIQNWYPTFTAVTPANLSVKQNDDPGLSIFPNPLTNGL
jgi:hypothetical protein